MNPEELAEEVKKTKNYSSLYQPLINRVCSEEFHKYKKDKEKIKAVKTRLHIIYGAFFSKDIKPRFSFDFKTDKDCVCEPGILKLSASSNERLPTLSEFYKFIFENINNTYEITSILDIACGFNPFSLPFIRPWIKNLKYYYALDIDTELAETLNRYFESIGLPKLAGCIDIISEIPEQQADIAFLFKIIPTIENCKKGRGFELINNVSAKYIIITFPVKTLCGKNKGMAENYAEFFGKNIDCAKFSIVAENIIGNELIYILLKK